MPSANDQVRAAIRRFAEWYSRDFMTGAGFASAFLDELAEYHAFDAVEECASMVPDELVPAVKERVRELVANNYRLPVIRVCSHMPPDEFAEFAEYLNVGRRGVAERLLAYWQKSASGGAPGVPPDTESSG